MKWVTYTDGVPPGRSLLWSGPDVVGMVIPGEPYWSTYYLVDGAMRRGTKADDEAAAKLTVESKLASLAPRAAGV